MSTETTTMDPMTRAADEPDVAALQLEYELAWTQGVGMINGVARLLVAEDTRYTRWHGQCHDGRIYGNRLGGGKLARPYEGGPDTRFPLADDTINALVSMLLVAHKGARVNPVPVSTSKLTLAEAAEFRAVVQWITGGVLADNLADNVEFLAQVGLTLGWCYLHPSWVKRRAWICKYVTMDEVRQYAARFAPEDMASQAEAVIMDPEMEDAAVALVHRFVADVETGEPHLTDKAAKKLIKDLRETGEGEYEVPEVVENRPELEVLIPGVDAVTPVEMTYLSRKRCWFLRRYYNEADLIAAANEDPENPWDESFVNAAKQTAGVANDQTITNETELDENMRQIEIVTAFVHQVKDGVEGVWCTVFSPNIVGKGYQKAEVRGPQRNGVNDKTVNAEAGNKTVFSDKALYGAHYLLDFAHGHDALIDYRLEVVGKRPSDSRGVAERLSTQQSEAKTQRDGLFAFTELSITPPLKKMGSRASKLPPDFGPLAVFNFQGQNDWSWFAPPAGNPEVAFKLIEQIKQERDQAFGIVTGVNPPAVAAELRQRNINRWLNVWARCYWQLAVLTYQHLKPEELAEVIGHPPLLSVDKILTQRLQLHFDAKGLDEDWVDTLFKHVVQLIEIDSGGEIDHSKLIGILVGYLDPSIGPEIMTDKAGAAQAVFKDVRGEMSQIMQGNEAVYQENDPTAGMKLQFAKQIVGNNPDWMQVLHPQGKAHDPRKAMLMEKYVQNLQQSVLQQQNKQIGRIGVRPAAAGG